MWRQGLAPVPERWVPVFRHRDMRNLKEARAHPASIQSGRALACCLALAACLLALAERADAARFSVQTLVPTFGGSTSLGANVSTILALRLWTTLRPRPNPNPNNLDFGVGQIKWSTRVIEGPRQAALQEAIDTRSQLALWGAVAEYGPGVIVTSNLIVSPSHVGGARRQIWAVAVRNVQVELGLPNSSYQFSPLVLSSGVVAKYSRPNQIRVCSDKRADCSDGTLLGDPFRVIRLEGDFVLVRQPDRSIGWVTLPDLSEAQGEVVDFTAALISYLRGDFEQAETYFTRVAESKAESLVRHDAALLAGISRFRRGNGIEALRAAQSRNPYSLFAVQALVTADIMAAMALPRGRTREAHLAEARRLIASYRDIFPPDNAWLASVERSFELLN
jgi:hypothetical protein